MLRQYLLILRANFLLATFVPIIFGIIWSLQFINFSDINIPLFISLILGIISCHLAANTFNDYFDWISGADQINTEYIPTISGGSRGMENGIITEQQLFFIAIFFSILAITCAIYISIIRGPIIFLLSGIGAFSAYFYTAPPIRLAARYGLGELFIFLCFGPVLITGIIYVLIGEINYTNLLIGLPIGIFITTVIMINEIPDLKSDRIAGKTNLAVVIGKEKLPYFISFLIILGYIITAYEIHAGFLQKIFYISMLTIPIALYEIILLFNINKNHNYISKACFNGLKLYSSLGLSFIFASVYQLF